MNIKPGDLWDFSRLYGATDRCVVVRPNVSPESSGSWVMRRLADGRIVYMHRSALKNGVWKRVSLWSRLRSWAREVGLCPLGYAHEDFRHGHHLIRVWAPMSSARWEVWRWPSGTTMEDVVVATKTIGVGSRAAYEIITRLARPAYVGRDAKAARAMMSTP